MQPTLHFDRTEYAARMEALKAEMAAQNLDAVLLFAPESMYWLTGFDTFGYCFFQCLVVTRQDEMVLLTRSADLRQAEHTSLIEEVVLWTDRAQANPARNLKEILNDLDLLGTKIGVEYATHGLTAANGRLLDQELQSFAELSDASLLVSRLRLIKSEAEIAYVRQAGLLTDQALDAALPLIAARESESAILAAMQNAILIEGGDYPANPFIIGSGQDALLCRYKSGRRTLGDNDQITLEWSGVFRHYHAPAMRTIVTGKPGARHLELHAAAREALQEVEKTLRPGNTFGDVFAVHSRIMEDHGLLKHRFNACGYSVGARFAPSWMEHEMFYKDNEQKVLPNMTLFAHMIIMDSDTGTAMSLGRTYLTGEETPESLSRFGLDLIDPSAGRSTVSK